MSRQEAMEAFIESGMELRRDDIELGRKLERERIIKLLENRIKGCEGYECETCDEQIGLIAAKALIKGEQK